MRLSFRQYFFEHCGRSGRKSWHNLKQKEAFEQCESEVGFEAMKAAIDYALASGISNVNYIIKRAKGRTEGGKGVPTEYTKPN